MKARSYLVVGAQFGDEGKGKIVDVLVERGGVEVAVRFNGGANAGHTIVLDDGRFPLHQIPSGILHPHVINFIAAGMVVDPPALVREMAELQRRGISCENLRVSDRAHLVMPWHRALDAHLGRRLGTTARGIGPCYEDRAARRGLRVGDLVDEEGRVDRDHFARRVEEVLEEKNRLLTRVHGLPPLEAEAIVEEYCAAGRVFAPQVTDVAEELRLLVEQGRTVLYEGAQGALLDLDWGTYPYVTSSSVGVGGCLTGIGMGVFPEVRLGVVKAYATRVGEGPFPTELGEYARVREEVGRPPLGEEQRRRGVEGDDDLMGRWLREVGGEFGTTTGRPRRCGWLDLVAVRHAVRLSGLNALALTKLDVLDGIPTLKLCVGYRFRGRELRDFPARAHHLEECQPLYEEHPGWDTVAGAASPQELPPAARAYVARIEEVCGVPVRLLSVGSHRASSLLMPA